jgi:hypothetical protein
MLETRFKSLIFSSELRKALYLKNVRPPSLVKSTLCLKYVSQRQQQQDQNFKLMFCKTSRKKLLAFTRMESLLPAG